MNKLQTTLLAATLAFIASSTALYCVAATPANSATVKQNQSCSKFVRTFYDWYTSYSNQHQKERTSDSAIKLKANWFAPALVKQLKEDSAAQDKVSGELVGLDFDPFLSTNGDPYDKYVVGEASTKGGKFFVNVYGSSHNKRSAKPAVVPELALRNGQWVFTNFHYGSTEPVNENLVSVLKFLAESRKKNPS